MSEAVIEIESPKTGEVEAAVYEHPWAVRFSHWLNAVSLLVMVASGFQIFRAFPSFGAKIPQKDLLHWPKASPSVDGWAAACSGTSPSCGFTSRPVFSIWAIRCSAGTIARCCSSARYSRSLAHGALLLFLWPKPVAREVYNPLQKLAYTSVLGLGILSVLTGLAVWKPVQFSWLAWMMGGFHWARIWHFAVMWAILFFLLGHWSWWFCTAGVILPPCSRDGRRIRNISSASRSCASTC